MKKLVKMAVLSTLGAASISMANAQTFPAFPPFMTASSLDEVARLLPIEPIDDKTDKLLRSVVPFIVDLGHVKVAIAQGSNPYPEGRIEVNFDQLRSVLDGMVKNYGGVNDAAPLKPIYETHDEKDAFAFLTSALESVFSPFVHPEVKMFAHSDGSVSYDVVHQITPLMTISRTIPANGVYDFKEIYPWLEKTKELLNSYIPLK